MPPHYRRPFFSKSFSLSPRLSRPAPSSRQHRLGVDVDVALVVLEVDLLAFDCQESPQLGGNQQPSLRVHFGVGAVGVRDKPEVLGRFGILPGFPEYDFVFSPDRNRVNSSCALIKGRDENLAFAQPVQVLLDHRRQLQPPLLVHACRVEPTRVFDSDGLGYDFHFGLTFGPLSIPLGPPGSDCHTRLVGLQGISPLR